MSFGPNQTVEVRPNSSAEQNVWWVTRSPGHYWFYVTFQFITMSNEV